MADHSLPGRRTQQEEAEKTVNTNVPPSRAVFATLLAASLVPLGCEAPTPPAAADLPPAYTSNQITDPELRMVADGIRAWASERKGAGEEALYSRAEVLPPVPIVQPYGIGVFQQEERLPVIFTTGPGWSGLKLEEKEVVVAQAFRDITERLQALKPTLTIQTPQGMELSWINHLDSNGHYVHGDDE